MVRDRPEGSAGGVRARGWGILIAASLAVLGGGVGPAAAQDDMRPLEDALGDSLEVRRDDAPDAPQGDDPGEGGSDATSGGGTAGEDPDGGGSSSSTDPSSGPASEPGSDGLRDPVPADDGAGGEAPGGGGGPDAEGSDPGPGLDLDRGDERVEGEGRGPGELVTGVPGRTVPIAVAVLAVLGSGGALVATQRRLERSGG